MSFETSLYEDGFDDEPILSFSLSAPMVHSKPQVVAPAPAPVPAIPEPQANNLNNSSEIKNNNIQGDGNHPLAACKLFVGGLKWDTSKESLRSHFEKFGSINECVIMMDTMTGKSRGFGFVTFTDPKSIDRILKQDHVVDGKIVDPKRAVPQENDGLIAKIFIGGIPMDVDNETLAHYFTSYGVVLDASLMVDRVTGRSRGFGFVTFEDYACVDACLEAQKREPLMMRGKKIEVKPATPRSRMNGPGQGQAPVQQAPQQQQYQQPFQQYQQQKPQDMESRDSSSARYGGSSKDDDYKARENRDRPDRRNYDDYGTEVADDTRSNASRRRDTDERDRYSSSSKRDYRRDRSRSRSRSRSRESTRRNSDRRDDRDEYKRDRNDPYRSKGRGSDNRRGRDERDDYSRRDRRR